MYIVVRNDEDVLSRPTPNGELVWLSLGVTRATEYRYAVTFETARGAGKCAYMYGGLAALADQGAAGVARGGGSGAGVGAGGVG